jgi:hypothetical protein
MDCCGGEIIPITDDTDQDLADNDSDDLEIGHGVDPLLVADFEGFPAGGPGSLEEGSQVTDGEEDVTARELII